jgi:hypothetical protein
VVFLKCRYFVGYECNYYDRGGEAEVVFHRSLPLSRDIPVRIQQSKYSFFRYGIWVLPIQSGHETNLKQTLQTFPGYLEESLLFPDIS